MALDFVANYDTLFPSIVAVKAKESAALTTSQRRTPVRKRTKPVDMRMSRSSLAASQNSNVASMPTSGSATGLKDTVVQESQEFNARQPTTTFAATATLKPNVQTVVEEQSNMTDEVAPTPISERVLGGLPDSSQSTAAAHQSEDNYLGVDSSIVAAIDTGASVGSSDSAYGTPPAESGALPSTEEGFDAKAGDNNASSNDATTDKPLSNVARLSKQFGASASGSSVAGPRGPRPAGGRAVSPAQK